jgi:hypothetical protein
MPSNLTMPNQCSRFSTGCIMDLGITIFCLELYFEFHLSFFFLSSKFQSYFGPRCGLQALCSSVTITPFFQTVTSTRTPQHRAN